MAVRDSEMRGDPAQPAALDPFTGSDAAEVQRCFTATLLNSLSEGVVAFDAAGHPVVFNQALRDLYGLSGIVDPREAFAAAIPRLYHLDGTPMAAGDLAVVRAMRGQTVRDVESLLLVPGLPERYVQTSAQPIRAGDGRQIGAVSTVRDVTERRRTEQFRDCELAVVKILNRAGTITEAAAAVLPAVAQALTWPHAVLWLTDDASGALRPAGQYTAPGRYMADLIPTEIPRGEAGAIGQAWITGQPVWVPRLSVPGDQHPPGLLAFLQACRERGLTCLAAAPIRVGDTTLGVLSGLSATAEHDEFLITGFLTGVAGQLAHFLSRARAGDLAGQLARSRADFTTVVGHDMRTPLTAISGYTGLLLDDPSTDDDRQLLTAIDRNTAILRGLVDTLLDLTALQAGHLPLRRRDVDLTALLAGACDAVQPAARAAGLTLRTRLDPGVHVTGDPDRLRQLADLLLGGALKAHHCGGEVGVVLARAGSTVELVVAGPAADHGGPAGPQADIRAGADPGDSRPGAARALAEAIVEHHHGTLTHTGNQDTADAVVTVRLPTDAHLGDQSWPPS